jgi:hypothetical protein
MKMMEALSERASMSVVMCLCRLRPVSSTASAEREVTLYVAIGREGIMEGRGFIAPGFGGVKLMSSCLCLWRMRARFLVRVVVRRCDVRV